MSTSRSSSRILMVDCNGVMKRYSYFFTSNKNNHYSFDRFCNILIESIVRIKPSIIYTTQSSSIDSFWRKKLFPEYQSQFISSPCFKHYNENINLLNELPEYFPMINHIRSNNDPDNGNESGDLISTLINKHTSNEDDIFVLAQPSKFEQLLSFNEFNKKINIIKTVKKYEDGEDDELNFLFQTLNDNTFGLKDNKLIIDYLSLVGSKGDNIPGVKHIGPVRAKKLLQIGNVPYLMTNNQWKQENGNKCLAQLIDDNSDKLSLFYNKLIPFDDNVDLLHATETRGDNSNVHDTLSLLQLIEPFAQKYDLKSILYRLRKNRYDSEGI